MIIEQLDPTGVVVETIDLQDCFGNLRDVYQRYKIVTSDGTYILTPESCYQVGWRIEDTDVKPKPFKFK